MTLNQAYERFLQHGSVYWSPGTLVYYKRNLRYFIRYAETQLGTSASQLPIDALPNDIVLQYVVWLRSKNRYDTHPLYRTMNVSGTVKSNTVNSYVRAVKAFFNFLYEREYTHVHFTKGLRLPRPDRDQILPLLESEAAAIDQMFERTSPEGLRSLCMVHLMLDAGLRACEVIHLKTRDILFASGAIAVNRSKGNKSRLVLLCPSLASLLQEYLAAFHPEPDAPLFSRIDGTAGISYSVLHALFRRIGKETGITRIHPHLLRHTFATSYIMGGGNLESLRILLGHYDYTVTRSYLHLASQYQLLNSPIYKLDPAFFRKGY